MKTISFLLALMLPAKLLATGQQVRFALTVHSEVAGGGGTSGIPATPNFTSVSTPKLTYVQWREALINFAKQCKQLTLPCNFQSDYNFLEGVRRWEITLATADPTIVSGSYTDNSLPAYTYEGKSTSTDTNGKNVIKYLNEDLGVEIDPHSHESNVNYNYADVAWLVEQGCSTTVSKVVGGHVYVTTSSKYQNWPKFIGGLSAATHTVSGSAYVWTPHLLMGGGGDTHKTDPHCTGLWKPLDANNYFTDGGSLAAIGHWEQDFFETDRLLRLLEDNSLPHNNKLWTCGRVMNHRDLVLPNYLTVTCPAILNTIKQWRDAGRFQVKTFEDIYTEWTTTFAGASSLYVRPVDNVSFSLNWQDFCYRTQSYSELRLLLNHHEAMRVPVDVFLTTWQLDYLEAEAPELLGRLFSSQWVNVSYHIRAPKPYAYTTSSSTSTTATSWMTYTTNDVATYETSKLDMFSGQPISGVSGGYGKLTSLYGSAPRIVGPNWDTGCRSIVFPYFYNAGARMVVQHDGNSAVTFGTSVTVNGVGSLNVRPESYDWKLIETYDPSVAPSTAIISNTLDEALSNAHTASGAASPYFTNVKLHDNDLFATASAWVSVYSKKVPTWDPTIGGTTGYTGPFKWADRLTTTESSRRRSFYARNLSAVAVRRTSSLNIVDTRDTLSMLGEDAPRPIGLSVTEIPDGTTVGTVLAEITGGGTESGLQCSYTLVGGTDSDDNADFSISGSSLIQARTLDRATKAVRHLRLRWTDLGGATGERAMTLVLGLTDDDGDGLTNEDELAAGTDPEDATSRLAISSTQFTGNQVTITWQSAVGTAYHIEYSMNLATWATVSGTQVTATSSTTSATVTNATADSMFFRVVVE